MAAVLADDDIMLCIKLVYIISVHLVVIIALIDQENMDPPMVATHLLARLAKNLLVLLLLLLLLLSVKIT